MPLMPWMFTAYGASGSKNDTDTSNPVTNDRRFRPNSMSRGATTDGNLPLDGVHLRKIGLTLKGES